MTGLVILLLPLLKRRWALTNIGQVLKLAHIAAGLPSTGQTVLFNDGVGLVGSEQRPRVHKLGMLLLQVGHTLPIVITLGLVEEIQQIGFIL